MKNRKYLRPNPTMGDVHEWMGAFWRAIGQLECMSDPAYRDGFTDQERESAREQVIKIQSEF